MHVSVPFRTRKAEAIDLTQVREADYSKIPEVEKQITDSCKLISEVLQEDRLNITVLKGEQKQGIPSLVCVHPLDLLACAGVSDSPAGYSSLCLRFHKIFQESGVKQPLQTLYRKGNVAMEQSTARRWADIPCYEHAGRGTLALRIWPIIPAAHFKVGKRLWSLAPCEIPIDLQRTGWIAGGILEGMITLAGNEWLQEQILEGIALAVDFPGTIAGNKGGMTAALRREGNKTMELTFYARASERASFRYGAFLIHP